MHKEMRDSFTVAYDPQQKTVIEVWDVDGVLYAELPNGDLHTGTNAQEIFSAVLQADQVQLRDVECVQTPPKV